MIHLDLTEHHLDIELQPLHLNPAQMDLHVLSGWLAPSAPLSLASMSASAADALPHPQARFLAKARRLSPGQPWHVGLKVSKTMIVCGKALLAFWPVWQLYSCESSFALSIFPGLTDYKWSSAGGFCQRAPWLHSSQTPCSEN